MASGSAVLTGAEKRTGAELVTSPKPGDWLTEVVIFMLTYSIDPVINSRRVSNVCDNVMCVWVV